MTDHEHQEWECPYFDNDPLHFGYECVIYKYSGGYEWDAAGIWRRLSDGQLFSWAGGGCSCTSPYDYLPNELVPYNPDSFMRAIMDLHELSGHDRVELIKAAL